jgi:hypothetical protein
VVLPYQVSDKVQGDPISIPIDLYYDSSSFHAKWSDIDIGAAVKEPSHNITFHISYLNQLEVN